MILSPNEDIILYSIANKVGIGRLYTKKNHITEDVLTPDRLYNLENGNNGYFSTVSSDGSEVMRIELRAFSAPDEVLANVHISKTAVISKNGLALFANAKCDYLVYINVTGKEVLHLAMIDAEAGSVELQSLNWFYDMPYDYGYQGIIGAYKMSGSALRLITVARSSEILVYDPMLKKVTGQLSLADRSGSGRLCFIQNGFLAIDYDTLVKVNLVDQEAKKTLLIQPLVPYEVVPGTTAEMRQFAGDVYVDKDERFAYVARPFSNDVVIVDLSDFQVVKTISVTGQPLEVVCIGQKIFTRDWKTGELSITQI